MTLQMEPLTMEVKANSISNQPEVSHVGAAEVEIPNPYHKHLGLDLENRDGNIYVVCVSMDGLAKYSECIFQGDEILEVNHDGLKHLRGTKLKHFIDVASDSNPVCIKLSPGEKNTFFQNYRNNTHGLKVKVRLCKKNQVAAKDVETKRTATKPTKSVAFLETNHVGNSVQHFNGDHVKENYCSAQNALPSSKSSLLHSTSGNTTTRVSFEGAWANPPTAGTPSIKVMHIDNSGHPREQALPPKWGRPRVVEVYRDANKSLGIKIVGSRRRPDLPDDQQIFGNFIKEVSDESPAHGLLHLGDQILQVDGQDLQEASHDRAVQVILAGNNPVTFLVKSILAPDLLKKLPEATMPVITTKPLLPKGEPADQFGMSHAKVMDMYSDLEGELHCVDITRSPGQVLGLGLMGHRDLNIMATFVYMISAGSAAAKDGRLHVGDELLEVNGQTLLGRCHLRSGAIIQGVKSNIIKFIFLRRPNTSSYHLLAKKPRNPETITYKYDPATLITRERPPSPPTPVLNDVSGGTEEVIEVTIDKGDQGFGIALHQGRTNYGDEGIFIKEITDSSSSASKLITPGAQVLAANGVEFTNMSVAEGNAYIQKSSSPLKLKLLPQATGGSASVVDSVMGSNNSTVLSGDQRGVESGQLSPARNAVSPKKSSPAVNSNAISQGEVKGEELPAAGDEHVAPSIVLDPVTAQIKTGESTWIEIVRKSGDEILGLRVTGGKGTVMGTLCICDILTNGAASRDGRLNLGDQLLEIEGVDIVSNDKDFVNEYLKTPPLRIPLLIMRVENWPIEQQHFETLTYTLNIKPPKLSIGIDVTMRHSDPEAKVIREVIDGTTAKTDGRLQVGDELLRIKFNGTDIDVRPLSYLQLWPLLFKPRGKTDITVKRIKCTSEASAQEKNKKKKGLFEMTTHNRGRWQSTEDLLSTSPTQTQHVVLSRDQSGSLGLFLTGGKDSPTGDDGPLIVASLSPFGPAALSGKIKAGDQILEINGKKCSDITHQKAVELMRCSSNQVTLEIFASVDRRTLWRSSSVESDISNCSSSPTARLSFANVAHDVQLCRKPGESLGLSIVGGRGSQFGDVPVYIKTVHMTGAVSRLPTGELKRGDQLIAINGELLEGMTHHEVIECLQNAQGDIVFTVLS